MVSGFACSIERRIRPSTGCVADEQSLFFLCELYEVLPFVKTHGYLYAHIKTPAAALIYQVSRFGAAGEGGGNIHLFACHKALHVVDISSNIHGKVEGEQVLHSCAHPQQRTEVGEPVCLGGGSGCCCSLACRLGIREIATRSGIVSGGELGGGGKARRIQRQRGAVVNVVEIPEPRGTSRYRGAEVFPVKSTS